MKYTEHLILRARQFWQFGEALPLTLFAEMNAAGLDVETLEGQYLETHIG